MESFFINLSQYQNFYDDVILNNDSLGLLKKIFLDRTYLSITNKRLLDNILYYSLISTYKEHYQEIYDFVVSEYLYEFLQHSFNYNVNYVFLVYFFNEFIFTYNNNNNNKKYNEDDIKKCMTIFLNFINDITNTNYEYARGLLLMYPYMDTIISKTIIETNKDTNILFKEIADYYDCSIIKWNRIQHSYLNGDNSKRERFNVEEKEDVEKRYTFFLLESYFNYDGAVPFDFDNDKYKIYDCDETIVLFDDYLQEYGLGWFKLVEELTNTIDKLEKMLMNKIFESKFELIREKLEIYKYYYNEMFFERDTYNRYITILNNKNFLYPNTEVLNIVLDLYNKMWNFDIYENDIVKSSIFFDFLDKLYKVLIKFIFIFIYRNHKSKFHLVLRFLSKIQNKSLFVKYFPMFYMTKHICQTINNCYNIYYEFINSKFNKNVAEKYRLLDLDNNKLFDEENSGFINNFNIFFDNDIMTFKLVEIISDKNLSENINTYCINGYQKNMKVCKQYSQISLNKLLRIIYPEVSRYRDFNFSNHNNNYYVYQDNHCYDEIFNVFYEELHRIFEDTEDFEKSTKQRRRSAKRHFLKYNEEENVESDNESGDDESDDGNKKEKEEEKKKNIILLSKRKQKKENVKSGDGRGINMITQKNNYDYYFDKFKNIQNHFESVSRQIVKSYPVHFDEGGECPDKKMGFENINELILYMKDKNILDKCLSSRMNRQRAYDTLYLSFNNKINDLLYNISKDLYMTDKVYYLIDSIKEYQKIKNIENKKHIKLISKMRNLI